MQNRYSKTQADLKNSQNSVASLSTENDELRNAVQQLRAAAEGNEADIARIEAQSIGDNYEAMRDIVLANQERREAENEKLKALQKQLKSKRLKEQNEAFGKGFNKSKKQQQNILGDAIYNLFMKK